MSETIGRLLAVGNVAEVFECGSRVLKLYRSAVRKPTPFREAAIHATVETMGLPVPAVWGVQEVGGRWGIGRTLVFLLYPHLSGSRPRDRRLCADVSRVRPVSRHTI
jgi:hypothetical protein